MWIGTESGGLNRFSSGTFTHFGASAGLGNNVWTITSDTRGTLWVGTDDGLSRREGERFVTLRERDGLSSDRVWALHEGRDGTLWIGTFGGLDAMRDGRLTPIGRGQGPLGTGVRAIVEDDGGRCGSGRMPAASCAARPTDRCGRSPPTMACRAIACCRSSRAATVRSGCRAAAAGLRASPAIASCRSRGARDCPTTRCSHMARTVAAISG